MAPMASSNSSFVHPRLRHSPSLRRRLSLTVSASFRLADLLGGRGLCNGEVGLLKELSSSPVPTTPATTTSDTPAPPLSPPPPTVDPAAFDKELMGLTGGFPGGEVGLQSFLAKNPPPSKNQETGPTGSLSLVQSSRPLPPELPLFLPGMVVIVKNPKNPFHMYTGIVQRVTDGEAGVLFEGGNWDKLFTFRLDELERRDKGPPMVNPKSAVLEPIVAAREKEEQEQQSAAAKE